MENKAIELAEYLEGTCKSLHDGMADLKIEEDQPIEFFEMLDEIVFECTGCGWWYCISERSECEHANYCNDCWEEEEE